MQMNSGENGDNTMKRLILAFSMIVVVAVALLSAGCATKAGTGALVGGAVGAGTGAIVGHQLGSTGAGAVIGGAVGAGTGAVVGNDMDRRDQGR